MLEEKRRRSRGRTKMSFKGNLSLIADEKIEDVNEVM